MRVSSNGMFDSNINRLNELQAKLEKISQQVSSGRKLTSPSDDPSASGRVLDITQAQAINQQYTNTRLYAKNSLSSVDGTLSNLTASLQSIHENVLAASNYALSSNDRLAYANVLQGERDNLLSLVNSTDSSGRYLLSGTKTNAPAFAKDSSGNLIYQYQGDIQQSLVQVDSGRTMATSVTADSLFGSSGEFFNKLDAAIQQLNDPQSSADTVATSMKGLNEAFSTTLQNMINAQSSVGIRLQQLDEMDKSGESRDLQYSDALSSLQDLDYNKALSDLTRQQTILQAAQKTFAQLGNLSVFNYI